MLGRYATAWRPANANRSKFQLAKESNFTKETEKLGSFLLRIEFFLIKKYQFVSLTFRLKRKHKTGLTLLLPRNPIQIKFFFSILIRSYTVIAYL